jgi:hypothetical protein
MKKLILLSYVILYGNFISAQNKVFNIDDLVGFSKSRFGFVQSNGEVNEYYGDFDCLSKEKYIFEFNVGCGRGGDKISILIRTNKDKLNTFDMFVDKGSLYYGIYASSEVKVGQLEILSDNRIKGNIKLCLYKNESCCGEEGESFILLKIK